jgi:dihydrodipicolinate synthase/N-acetylneuraminate lyase
MKQELTAEQVIVPMISPFEDDFSVDLKAISRMCEMFVKAGVSIFALGTTGEGDSLASEQCLTLLKQVVLEVQGQTPIYAGLTGNSLQGSIHDSKRYADLGADCLVAKLPSYYPMNDSQMLLYLEKLADAVPLPLFIYNIPATTHHSIPLKVVEQLSYHPNIFGLKDSERDLERLDQSIALWGDRDDFDFLVGWAPMSSYGLLKGANGIVPSTGNITPELYVRMVEAIRMGDEFAAKELQEKTNLLSALYQKDRSLSESIPALKMLMKSRGLCSGVVLPPMRSMSWEEENEYLNAVKEELEKLLDDEGNS